MSTECWSYVRRVYCVPFFRIIPVVAISNSQPVSQTRSVDFFSFLLVHVPLPPPVLCYLSQHSGHALLTGPVCRDVGVHGRVQECMPAMHQAGMHGMQGLLGVQLSRVGCVAVVHQ